MHFSHELNLEVSKVKVNPLPPMLHPIILFFFSFAKSQGVQTFLHTLCIHWGSSGAPATPHFIHKAPILTLTIPSVRAYSFLQAKMNYPRIHTECVQMCYVDVKLFDASNCRLQPEPTQCPERDFCPNENFHLEGEACLRSYYCADQVHLP